MRTGNHYQAMGAGKGCLAIEEDPDQGQRAVNAMCGAGAITLQTWVDVPASEPRELSSTWDAQLPQP